VFYKESRLTVSEKITDGDGQDSPARETCLSANSPYYHTIGNACGILFIIPMFELVITTKRNNEKTPALLSKDWGLSRFNCLACAKLWRWSGLAETCLSANSPYYHMIGNAYGILFIIPMFELVIASSA